MERIQDLVYTHVQGGQFRWVTVSTLMLALGTILHLVSPSVAGVTPNWTIAVLRSYFIDSSKFESNVGDWPWAASSMF